MNPWKCLEAIPGLIAVPAVWQRRMGENFPALNAICLDPDPRLALSYPCPLKCGCWHKVILRHDSPARTGGPPLTHSSSPLQSSSSSSSSSSLVPPPTLNSGLQTVDCGLQTVDCGLETVDCGLQTVDCGLQTVDCPPALAICRCTPPACPDFPLSLADITPLKLNWKKLGRELCRALTLTSKFAILAPPNTVQIGSWSAAAVPAILTIQIERYHLRSAIAELAALLAAPFILFVPTTDQIDARHQTLLQKFGAALFPLDSTLIITTAGTLEPVRAPGELFARFTPQPKDLDLDVAQRAFALIQQLESEIQLPPPTSLTVFRLYCIEALSAAEAARKCHCSKATIISRLALIHKKTGTDPRHLRTLSPHIAKLDSTLSDPRAKRIHRQSAIDDETETED